MNYRYFIWDEPQFDSMIYRISSSFNVEYLSLCGDWVPSVCASNEESIDEFLVEDGVLEVSENEVFLEMI